MKSSLNQLKQALDVLILHGEPKSTQIPRIQTMVFHIEKYYEEYKSPHLWSEMVRMMAGSPLNSHQYFNLMEEKGIKAPLLTAIRAANGQLRAENRSNSQAGRARLVYSPSNGVQETSVHPRQVSHPPPMKTGLKKTVGVQKTQRQGHGNVVKQIVPKKPSKTGKASSCGQAQWNNGQLVAIKTEPGTSDGDASCFQSLVNAMAKQSHDAMDEDQAGFGGNIFH